MIELTERLHESPELKCRCYTVDARFEIFSSAMIGIDERNGRFAEITIFTCNHCKTKWIKYFAEFESFSKSGRWYRGIISEPDLLEIKPDNAVEYLEKLDWYIYGGSYFPSTGMYGKGKVKADLM